MSVVAETSKTALEIYQPVIVGLGAVVLGFLANGILEIWKAKIAERREQGKVRKAVYSELKKFSPIWKTSCEHSDGDTGARVTFIKFSSYLDAIEPSMLCELTPDEIASIVHVVTMQDGVMHFLQLEGCDPAEDRFFRCAEGANIKNFNGLLEQFVRLSESCDKALKEMEKKL